MATEEIGRRSPLPPYNPQLILDAIDELNQKEGANMSTVSKYIESKYGHSNLLSATLYAMKETGEIIFVENNYLRPDSNYSIRPFRSRGRPPKPKDPHLAEAAAVSGTPKCRGRGRPKKDTNGPPGEVSILKNNYLSSDSNDSVRRGRGRPPKPKDPLAEAGVASPSPKSRGRGRPKKDPNGPPDEVIILKNNYLSSDSNNSVSRGRGRPPKPKDPLPEAAMTPPGPKSRSRPKKDPNASSAPKKQKVDPIPVPFIGDVASPPVFKTGRPRGRPIKEGGGVNFLKNKYLGPDPNNLISPGRGRGRPQKPKATVVSSSPKSRGRPKKDPIVPPTPNKQNLDPVLVLVPFTGDEASPPL